MKVLIVYDSVSPNKNTERVANLFSEALKEEGFEVDCLHVSSVDRSAVKDYQCVIVGSPTMAWSATKPVKEFLEDFNSNEFVGKYAVAFDTRIKSRLSGQATKGIEDRLKKLGFKIVASPLIVFVEGDQRTKSYCIRDGELEKARQYVKDLAKILVG